jgi:hypothetical protein
MRRPFVLSTGALALALLPAVLSAQTPTAQQPPPPQPAQSTEAKPAEAPKVPFTTPAGLLLVQVKPDQTAVFEEMIGKLKTGLANTADPTLKQQAAGFKIFKVTEPFNNNVLYLVMAEPAVPNTEYELFSMLVKTMTKEQLAAPETTDMWKKYQSAFAAGLSKLSLTPVGK